MAPNPIIIMPKEPAPTRREHEATGHFNIRAGIAWAIASILVGAFLVAEPLRGRRWLFSGSAMESVLLIHGSVSGSRILQSVPLWTLLASLNLTYALLSKSRLLYSFFAALCWPSVVLTCIFQFEFASAFTRRRLRRLLTSWHFTKDKVAFFNLPALELDIGTDGLVAIRGLTVAYNDLSLEAHGIELSLKLRDDLELTLYLDEANIRLFSGVRISEVYGALKLGKSEMSSTNDDAGAGKEDAVSSQSGAEDVTAVSLRDEEAEEHYDHVRQDVVTTSLVYQSRQEVESAHDEEVSPMTDGELRAAVCSKLQNHPSVPHAPTKSISITTILNLIPRWLRRFLRRVPFLLRLLLMPLSYLHPITVSSISISAPGKWFTPTLQRRVLTNYAEQDSEIEQLRKKMYEWLANANFCLDWTDMQMHFQTPLRTAESTIAYARSADITAFRCVSDSGSPESAVQLRGADATFVIPLYLLPLHEHLVPNKPAEQDNHERANMTEEAKNGSSNGLAENDHANLETDEAEIMMSIHGSFPASIDQSLLDFVSEFTKAAKVFEMEQGNDDDGDTQSKGRKLASRAKHLPHTVQFGVKKLMNSNMVNDQWVAEFMGKVAAQLERLQGDVGYSGPIPVALGPYRGGPDSPSKLLA